MDFSNFTFRCSSLGHIMQEPKGKTNRELYNELVIRQTRKTDELMACSERAVKKSEKLVDELDWIEERISALKSVLDTPVLSDGCKTHLCDIYTVVKYGRFTDIKSKYLEKGLLMEEDAITQYSLLTGKFYKKNKERKYNQWIEGELDLVDEDTVHDTKVNWDMFTFNRTVSRPIKPLYHWQLDGYMWLWGKKKAKLVYCLLNTPEHLIAREESRLVYEIFGSELNYKNSTDSEKEDYIAACEEIRHNHIYDDLSIKEKVRIFEVSYDEERIERLKARVEACRQYLNNFDKGILDYTESNDKEKY